MFSRTGIIVVVIYLVAFVYGKATLKKLQDCDANGDYKIKTEFKLKDVDGKQIVETGSISTKIQLDNDILDIAEVYIKEDNGEFEHLLTIKEGLCDAVNKFMGEFMHEMQEAAGLKAGACPVPAGDYQISEHPLDFNKFKFNKRIPEGEFRVVVNLMDAKTNETLNCHEIEFTIEK